MEQNTSEIINESNLNPSELSVQEKVILMRNTFIQQRTEENTVKNLSNYLAESYGKIDGFDYRWNSLVTSNPLLFEDIDYFRCKQYVNNQITEEEIQAYKRGELRDLYATFENMLICNLQYYDRIMSFCTMVFLHYVRLDSDEITSQHLEQVPYVFDMTPTQIWCCALSNTTSTEWELNYAWRINNRNFKFDNIDGKSLIETNWKKLQTNPIFNKFIEYSAFRNNSAGFRQTFFNDKTSNSKLSLVCQKFTRTSTAISQNQLNSVIDYVSEQESINKRLYKSLHTCMMELFCNDESNFAIYVYSKEFYIHSSKFSIKVSKSDTGKITKEYLANSYECFAAEEYLFPSIKLQIEWAKYQLPIQYDYDKQILSSLLDQMLKENYREIICIKRMNEYGVVSKIKFSGIFDNVYIIEDLMFDNHCIRSSKICMSKSKAAKYVIDRGYYIFGLEKDVYGLMDITRKTIIEHYTKYCIPVIQHMNNIIQVHIMSKNDIIDIVCSGVLNPNKLNNHNIKYASIKNEINPRKLMYQMFEKQHKDYIGNRKSYWKVIDQ